MNLIKKIFRSRNGNGASHPGLILPENEFRAILLHECARCDRNDSYFSLIQVDLQVLGGPGEERNLIRRVIRRIRITDEVGQLSGNTIGIFLPETSRTGAATFAEDVIGSHGYQIFRYPYTIRESNRAGGGSNGKKKDKSSGSHDGLFDQSAGMVPDASLRLKTETGWSLAVKSDNGNGNGRRHHRNIRELLHPTGLPRWKRTVDTAGAAALLLLLSPLFLAVAAFIKAASPGPVFFVQRRIGYLGRSFAMLKFRSMKASSDQGVHRDHLKKIIEGDGKLQKLDSGRDDRLIPLGGLLRKSCIDELPQLINVLRGEMSLVGPRPCLDYEAEEFASWQCGRFETMPGMTGLWQVSGKSRTTFTDMMRFDVRYSRRKSPGMDLGIFIRTPQAIVREAMDTIGGKRKFLPKSGRMKPAGILGSLVRQLFL